MLTVVINGHLGTIRLTVYMSVNIQIVDYFNSCSNTHLKGTSLTNFNKPPYMLKTPIYACYYTPR